jgi:hypothetical protein
MEPGVGIGIFSITLLNTATLLMPSIYAGMAIAKGEKNCAGPE